MTYVPLRETWDSSSADKLRGTSEGSYLTLNPGCQRFTIFPRITLTTTGGDFDAQSCCDSPKNLSGCYRSNARSLL
jgi:hypothetical protein